MLLRDEIDHFRDLMVRQERERRSLLIQIRHVNLDRAHEEEIRNREEEAAGWKDNMTKRGSHRMSILRLVEDLDML